MSHYDKLVELMRENPKNEDGDSWNIRLLPGLSNSAIERMERDAGVAFSFQTVELMQFVGGIAHGPMELVRF